MAQDVIWQNASEEQLQDAQLAIERSVMNRIFKLAFYPNQDGDILRDQWVLLSDGLSRTIPASPPSLDKLLVRHNIWVVKEKIGPFLTSQSYQPAQKESAVFSEMRGIRLEGRVHWSGCCGRHYCSYSSLLSSTYPYPSDQDSDLTSLGETLPSLSVWVRCPGSTASGLDTFL